MARVCMLSSVHAALDTRIFHREAKTLAKAGHEVIVVAQHPADEVVDGIRVEAIPRPATRFHRLMTTGWRLFQRARKARAEIYHFHDPELIPIALWLHWTTGARVIYDVHEDFPSVARSRAWIPRPLRGFVAMAIGVLERRVLPHFSAIVAADVAIGERCRRRNPRSIVVQNFPALSEWPVVGARDDRDREGATLLSLGGISSNRCAGEIVTAVGQLPAGRSIRLRLAGLSDSASLQREIESLPGWTQTDFLGLLPHGEAMQELRHADVSLVLYSDHPNHYAIRSNRLFQSMAAGVPVVGSDFPAWRRFLEEHACGLVVDPGDPKAIARAIAQLLANPKEAQAMGNRGRSAVEAVFNWECESERLLALYRELVPGSWYKA